MKNRGLYHQSEGNEHRNASSQFAERLEDNEIVEGRHIAVLKRMLSDFLSTRKLREQDWGAYNAYVDDLRKQGFSTVRINSIITQSTYKGIV